MVAGWPAHRLSGISRRHLADLVDGRQRIGREGAEPLPQAPLAPELLGLVQHVAAYERLAAEAAVSGDREIAEKAMLAHPLVGQWPLSKDLLHRMLEAELGAEVRR